MKYCSRCVYPTVAVNLVINGNVCSACQAEEENESSEVNWEKRAQEFRELAEKIKSESTGNYDCVIPVSGGKDSYFQTHVLKHSIWI